MSAHPIDKGILSYVAQETAHIQQYRDDAAALLQKAETNQDALLYELRNRLLDERVLISGPLRSVRDGIVERPSLKRLRHMVMYVTLVDEREDHNGNPYLVIYGTCEEARPDDRLGDEVSLRLDTLTELTLLP